MLPVIFVWFNYDVHFENSSEQQNFIERNRIEINVILY